MTLYYKDARLRWIEEINNFHILTTATDEELQEANFNTCLYLASIDDSFNTGNLYCSIFKDEEDYESIQNRMVTTNLVDTKKAIEDYLIEKGIVTFNDNPVDIDSPSVSLFEALEATQDIASSPTAVRFDADKDLWSLLPWLALREVAYIFTLGAKKYSDRNWEKGFNYSRVFNSLMRHLTAWWNGEDNDPESSRSHLAHAACNILFLLHFVLTNTGTDDRPQY